MLLGLCFVGPGVTTRSHTEEGGTQLPEAGADRAHLSWPIGLVGPTYQLSFFWNVPTAFEGRSPTLIQGRFDLRVHDGDCHGSMT